MRIRALFFIVAFLFCSLFASAALDIKFVTGITQTPNPVTAGNTVTFSVSFRPIGAAVTNMKIIGGVDGKQIKDRTYANISADATRTDSMTWTAEAGAHTAWFELDPAHSCGDSNYGNNRIEKSFTVGGGGPAALPNLQLKMNRDPYQFTAGQNVTIMLTVLNEGDAASGVCEMYLKKGNTILQTFNIPALAHNESINNTYSWNVECGATLNAKVDSNNVVVESSEQDNDQSDQMNCIAPEKPKPDLQLSVSVNLVKYEAGQDLNFSITVSNKGAGDSLPTELLFNDGSASVKLVLPIIMAGGQYSVTQSWKVICDATVIITVDKDNQNIESNEGNNTWQKKMACGKLTLPPSFKHAMIASAISPNKPDLTVKFLKVEKRTVGEGFDVTVEFENIGKANSVPCLYSFSTVSSAQEILANIIGSIPAIDKGQKITRITLSPPYACGNKIRLKVDYDDKNMESNENNNTAQKSITCSE